MSDDNSSSESDEYETADEQEENESEKTQLMVCKCERCSVPSNSESYCCRQFRKVDKECQDKGYYRHRNICQTTLLSISRGKMCDWNPSCCQDDGQGL